MQVGVRAGVLWVLLALTGCSVIPSQLSLTNESAEVIAEAGVIVGGEALARRSIAVGETWHQEIRIRREGAFAVSIRFESGRTIKKELGYVTPGFAADHKLRVSDSDIAIETSIRQ
jgi:hypothetical protein